jgi:hypothetical protein
LWCKDDICSLEGGISAEVRYAIMNYRKNTHQAVINGNANDLSRSLNNFSIAKEYLTRGVQKNVLKGQQNT